MSVRRAMNEDIETILGMGVMMHRESDYSLLTFEPSKFRTYLSLLIPHAEGIALVYENEAKEVVGFMLAVVSTPYFSDDKVANQILLYVLPTARGGRAGYRLIKAYKEEAIRMGAKQISLDNSTDIDAGRVSDLFQHMGFRHVGFIHHYNV